MQDSNIALDAFVDQSDMIAWTNSVVDGKPLAGVQLELLSAGTAVASGTSGADGLATLPLSGAAQILVARQGDDVSILPETTYVWGGRYGGWQKRPVNDEVRWYVFDDRKLYRPGEEVRVKGWFRRHEGQEGGDLSLFSGASRVSYKLSDARGNKLAEGEATANALGGFELKLQIPKEANLGYAALEITLNGFDTLGSGRYYHQLQIEEFRRPEFEVKTTVSEGPHLIGAHAVMTATANYYAGGGLPAADVTWNLTSRSGHYSPPNWSDFSFGRWIPWWFDMKPDFAREETETFAGRTDASGKHFLRIDFDSIDPPLPSTMDVQATVMDVNRQAWTSKTSLLVHPAELYVGLRSDRIFVQREDPLPVDVIVVDIDGNPVAGRQVRLTAVRTQWVYRSGEWKESDASQQSCIVESGREPVKCTFETPEGGTYRITAIVEDAAGRRNLTEVTRWVSGGDRPSARNVEQEEVLLIPDKKEYRPGDIAHILVQAPFSPAEGVVTLSRSGILSAVRFTMAEPSYTLDIPIAESHIPNLQVQVDLVGATARLDAAGEPDPAQPKRPAFAVGTLTLRVPPLARELKVAAEPREKALEPGGTTTVDVAVLDAAGKPVQGAELAVVVVDEAVLAMTGYKLPDPLSIFYSDRDPRSNAYHSRASIILAEPQITLQQREAMEKSAVQERAAMPMAAGAPAPAATSAPAAAGARQMAADAAFNAGEAPIAVRTDFSALALFAPSVVTDAAGKAQVEVKLPDSLTRYRVMAVAVSGGKQAGLGESAITARLPLMVRPSAPRFLNFGDRFELPVVVQNQTDAPMTVSVVARAGNARFTGASSVQVEVPANDRREVRFPVTTVSAGTARFQIGASGAHTGAADRNWVDAASVELPVWTPATAEAFATYGVLDSGSIAQPLIAPTGVYTQFGGLEITTSSTALQALTDAVIYLRDYPFDCAEQISSRMLGIAALRDVLSAFQAEGLPPADELRASVDADIARLRTLQNPDGGFPLWRRGDPDWPYVSVHVAHALQRARSKDFAVPVEMMELSRAYLREIDRHIPAEYGPLARNTIVAYSLYVRKQMGEADLARARKMVDDALSATPPDSAKLSAEGLGWLQFVLAGDPGSEIQLTNLRRHFDNQVVETAGAAHFGTPYGEQGYLLLASDRRADAVILEAMMADRPQSDLIPKLVTGLLAHRKAGRWSNTQENVFVLLALDKYFNTYEAQTPDFVARMWLGAQYAGQSEFRGRTTERSLVKVPMSMLVGGTGQQNVIVSKDGDGRLYYRLGLRYAPSDLDLKPADYGFTVERRYEAVDNAADVTQDANGVWHVKAGARVRTQITLVAPTRRYHVALVDPLPAGFEAQNPELAVTGSAPTEPPQGAITPSMAAVAPGGRPGPAAAPRIVASAAQPAAPKGWWFWRTWYEHQNLRDDRAEAFRSLLWDGVYSYSYVSRATTPGEFIVPPARAEEMYSPETFGRTGTDRVVVE